jgi:hypothetical protein
VISSEKKIYLDDDTAPKPPYIQIYEDASGVRMLTLLNPHNHSINFYDYTNATYLRKTHYEREGPDAVLSPKGYYIKNMDSIYVYNMPMTEVVLTDSAGRVINRIQLRGDDPDWKFWPLYFPQYLPSTVAPFIENQGKLILTGFSPFSLADTLIDKFHFTACIDMKTNQAEFVHTYPKELYGKNSNWEGGDLFTPVYSGLSPTGELIHSFPVSHDLYRAKWDEESYTIVYAGSNVTRTIRSIDREPKGTPNEVAGTHFLQQDLYAAILYDAYRKVYYRFMLQGIPGATAFPEHVNKPVIVILMDEQFNYLGETLIGTGKEWNWTNSFVTQEGLNIEYIDDNDTDEEYLNFKIFTIEKL